MDGVDVAIKVQYPGIAEAVESDLRNLRLLLPLLRRAARVVGTSRYYPADTQGEVEDDHTPFIQQGVPSIDLIDFTYPCWHRTCDDLKHVSKASLDISGETVRQLLASL